MKILLVGTFLPGSLELSYERAFKLLGLEVKCFDIGQVNRLLKSYWEYIYNKKIFEVLDAFSPDLILVIKGFYLCPKTIQKIQRHKKYPVYCFMGDNPFNLRYRGSTNKNILESIPYYDCYFIWTKSLIEPLLKWGAKRVELLPFGFDAELHHPIELSGAEKDFYAHDIVFVGNWDEEREKWLKELVDFDLGIWGGNYWLRHCKDRELKKKWRSKAIYADEMCKALSGSKISINILRNQNKGNHNMRTFEASACRTFVLAERTPEAQEFFAEDREAVYFSTPQELEEKARYYLKHEQERKQIAQAGYKRCISSEYSYLDRAEKILRVYEEMKKQ